MNTSRRILKNTSTLFLSQSAYFLTGLIVMTFAARILGVEDFGGFMFATSMVAFIEITANLGLNILLVREVALARDHVNKYWSNVFLIKIFLALLATFIIITITYLVDFEPKLIIIILAVSQLFNSIVAFNNAVFQAFETMQYQLYTTLTEKVFVSVFTILTLVMGFGILGLALVMLTGRLISFLVSMTIIYRKIIHKFAKIDVSFLSDIINKALPYAVFLIMGTVYFQLDSVLLSYYKGNTAVGYYQAALRIILVILIIPDVVTKALLPTMAQFYKDDKARLHKLYEYSVKYLVIIVLPIVILLYIYADTVIYIVFGTQYSISATVLKILCWVIALRFIAFVPGLYLTVIDKQALRTGIVGFIAVFSIIMNLILIPRYSYIGVATANLLSNFLLAGIYITVNQVRYAGVKLYKILVKPIIVSAIFFVFILLVGKIIPVYLAVPLALILYYYMLTVLRIVESGDRELILKGLVKK